MKLSPEQFDALVEYIEAVDASRRYESDDRRVFALMELEAQLKGDRE